MGDDPKTPANVTVLAVAESGTTTNITEGVQTLYDLLIGSMDWGSGFLSLEDALPVVHLARTCGFTGIEEAERYVSAEQHALEAKAYWQDEQRAAVVRVHAETHEHVYSSLGVCMWRYCSAAKPDAAIDADETWNHY